MGKLANTWRRVAQMGWDERRTRAAQEIHKRCDLALYRVGLVSNRSQIRSTPLAPGKFFFSPAELPDRVSLLKSRMSVEAEAVVREADQICNHRFNLLGYKDLDYGKQIDWHLDAVHGKRAPAKPWFKIDFLDFKEAGDHKVIWELNRHQHLVTLAKAWGLTQERRYVEELQTQWYSWQRENPYPIGINWGSSLEVGFRSISWIWVLSLLHGSSGESAFRGDVIRALAQNGRYIERYLSTYFSPNTHLLGEAAGLFFIGTLFPEISWANRWRENGWRILVEQAQRQVRADGVYFEQSLYYHVYALDFFLHARILAGKNGIVVPSDFDLVLNRMLDVVSGVSQAGLAEGFGDDDGGRVFDPRRDRTEHMTDPLAVGAILFQREDLKCAAALTEEAIWLFGERAVSSFDHSANFTRQIKSAAFVDGGIHVMASGSGANALQMTIDAGPQGTGRSGHGHADALSVAVAIGGRRWLVDSGAYSYVGPERDQFRGTAAHNTLRVDDLDQAVPDGPFAWKSIPQVRCDKWLTGKTFTVFEGSHTGYMRLSDPVMHRRCIFFLHDQFWVIRDFTEGGSKHRIEINWHFAPDVVLQPTDNVFVAKEGRPTRFAPGHIALHTVATSSWKPDFEDCELSPAYGKKDRSTALRFRHEATLPAEHAILIAPGVENQAFGRFSSVPASLRNPSAYAYESAGRKHFIIFSDPQTEPWLWNGWSSDARFFYFSVEDGIIADLIFCDGREVRLNGMPVFVHPTRVQRFEWNRRTGQVCSSDDSSAVISTQFLETFSPA